MVVLFWFWVHPQFVNSNTENKNMNVLDVILSFIWI